jgi:hypothetical protein
VWSWMGGGVHRTGWSMSGISARWSRCMPRLIMNVVVAFCCTHSRLIVSGEEYLAPLLVS